jgi:hypothetical protein
MYRRGVTVGAAVTAALLALAVVFLIHDSGRKATSGTEPVVTSTTTTPALTFVPPPTVPLRTLPTAPPPAPAVAANPLPAATPPGTYSTLRGQPPVSWRLTGACQASGDSFSCRVTVSASNGLESAGFVAVYLSSGYGQVCGERAAVARGSATLSGECSFHPVAGVQAVYSLTPLAAPSSNLATARLPLS